ncbi:L,D-transpeptidase [Vogesella oryzae]|uniref:L,D-transpeptidase n=1 Tax=Vogesella oryzae TaxID=1735285 RepID=UPI001583B805|nr:L,D-transpeptidase [Vogesella oryzae]
MQILLSIPSLWRVGLLCGLLAGYAAPALAVDPEPDVAIADQGQHLVVNLPQTRVYLYQDGLLLRTYPIAVGKQLTQTPTGNYSITGIYRDPTWHIPKSIQDEMVKQGKPLQTEIPPGPDNPLGKVFIRFGEPRLGLGFHGTNQPASVPGVRSHGCVRLRNENALALADWVNVGALVTIAYQPLVLNEDEAGELWLTAYRDVYGMKDPSYRYLANTLLSWQQEKGRVLHGARVDRAIRERKGVPVCLSCKDAEKAVVTGSLMAKRWLSIDSGGVPEDAESVRPAGGHFSPKFPRSMPSVS